jgi:hypothetical protein
MDDKLIAKIQSFTLSVRALLEQDISEQLEGIYQWMPNGDCEIAKTLSLPTDDTATEFIENTHRRILQWIANETEAGLNAKEARKKLIDEATFTWLNRLVAFKMMEERGLLGETISKLWEGKKSFIKWVTLPENGESYDLYNKGDLPQNILGEGPRQTAYRRFLLARCQELSTEVSQLFNPNTIASALCPRPHCLQQIVTLLNQTRNLEDENDLDFSQIWQPGNEEAIGWIYQAFNSEALEEAFKKAKQDNVKFSPKEIPAVTQLFTIRWVVKFLVENTLGRIWLEMHPDSRLLEKWSYLALPKEKTSRPLRPVSELTFLDPSCGSMHFGLIAYDLFAEMYQEELERAGEVGWLPKASVASQEEIPASIIANNLFGIDLDLRAVQLSSLALFVRARSENNQAAFTDSNLACANVEKLSGGKLEQFIQEASFSHPIYKRVLLKLAERLKDSENLGSLLRIEQDLRHLIDDERKKAKENTQSTLAIPGFDQEWFNSAEGIEEFFDVLSEQIQRHLDLFVQKSSESGGDESHFAGEAAKGMRYLRLVGRDYDVVATNPPYLSGRKMNKRMSELMKTEYPEGSGDLYAAFIVRCQELLQDSGLMGMLTMHSFMFISSYEALRDLLRKEVAIETLSHFGGHLFSVGNPGTLQTAAFVLRKEPDEKKREENLGTYFRLVKEKSSDAKRLAFEDAVSALRHGTSNSQLFHYRQKDFDAIPDKPWSYWMPDNVRALFGKFDLLKESAPPKQGLATAKNERFLRKWWELPYDAVDKKCTSCEETLKRKTKWFPYMKGGASIPWYGNQEHAVNWKEDGAEIKCFGLETGKIKSRPQNTDFYFRRGVTWSDVSSKGFAGRLSPGGFIHDVTGMTCFPEKNEIVKVLSVFNSQIGKFVLSLINPTIHFQVGDIERLPIPSEQSDKLNNLVEQAITLAKENSAESERTYDFVAPLSNPADYDTRMAKLAEVEAAIDGEVTRLYGLGEEDLKLIQQELADAPDAEEAEVSEGDEEATEDAAVGYSPETWARQWISYAIGIVLGRYAIGEAGALGCGHFSQEVNEALKKLVVSDGLLVSDAGHPLDITAKCQQALEILFGEDKAKELITTGCGAGDAEESLRTYLDGPFWEEHKQLYRHRPVYWPFETDTRKPFCHYRVWCFHEKLSGNTLFRIKQLSNEKIKFLESKINDLIAQENAEQARSKKNKLIKEKENTELFIDTLKAFIQCLDDIANGTGNTLSDWERGIGYQSFLDDGVLINAAPLWPLLPKWKQSGKRILKVTWEKMASSEDLDWAQQAMHYWPTRVEETCNNNQSIAIAHGKDEGGNDEG